MDNGNSVKGAALGTAFLLDGLMKTLMVKGILGDLEMEAIFETALVEIQQSQARDFPENEGAWDAARMYVEHILEEQVTEWAEARR